MRSFVDVFRTNLALAGASTDDETVWRLLHRFQILVFDFESTGSDYDHRAREHLRWILAPDQIDRANDLWPVIIDHVGASACAAGTTDRATIVTVLEQQQLLQQHLVVLVEGRPGVGKSAVMKHLAVRLQTEGCVLALRRGRIISGGWLAMARAIGWGRSQAELFNELGTGGGAILFIDNIDQIDDQGEWATVTDLLSQATRSQGWRIVATCGVESDDWKTTSRARKNGRHRQSGDRGLIG